MLFSDLVGSTSLAEKLDPEDLRAVVRSYHDAAARAITRYEGHVAKYLGDGVVAFFGFPSAHEDDSKRAVLAGLAIVEQVQALNPEFARKYGVEISVRVGIHSGVVVAGEMGSLDRPVMDIVGETPNIAARMQEVAKTNSVVVSADTYHLTEQGFHFEALGPRTLKGVSRPIDVYQVLCGAEKSGPTRRIVGRKDEISQLESLWKKARQGQGRLALIRGEPGIGKSTLVSAIIDRAEKEPDSATVLLRCSPYHQNTPFHPIIEYLRASQMRISRSDPPEVQLQRLEEFVTGRGFDRADTIPILAPLLSIPFESKYQAPNLSPEGRRQKTLEITLEMAVRRSARFCLILLLDNIHWADPSTLELLNKVLERLPGIRMLVIATYRSYYTPTIPRPAGSIEIGLDKLDHQAVWSLAKQVAGGKDLPFEILDHIASKTDGIPLFVEELTKTIIESGAVKASGKSYRLVGQLKDLAIPSTLQGSLVARLEHAAGRKEVAQVASVVGREFSVDIVAQVCKMDEASVNRQITSLVAADLIFPVDDFSGVRAYRFRHALIQDAAYDSLLKSVRQQYHRDIAKVLEASYRETVDEQPEVLAYHHTAGGEVATALQWWLQAGQKALARSANLEAIAHFTSGLDLLKELPDAPEKIQMELAMLAQRGTAYIATKGFAAPEVGETFRRAEQICEMIGDTPLLFPVIWGLWVYHLVRSDLEVSCGHAEHLLRLADISKDPGMYIEAHFTLGDSLFWLGRLDESKEHLDKALALYDPELHRANILLYGQDPGVSTLCYLAYTSWSLGYPDTALAFANRACEVADATSHPFSIGWGLAFAGSIRNWRKDFEGAREWAERSRDYCIKQSQAFWASASTASLGWARYYLGDREIGLELLRQGLAGYELTGSIVVTPLWRAILAEVLVDSGELDEAMSVIDRGLETIASLHEWVTEPYLRRVRGDVFARQGKAREAEAEYLRSFKQAEGQNAKMRALQAAMGLFRLAKTEVNEARLKKVYESFTEGFDTQDLKEARELLHVSAPVPKGGLL